MMSGIANSSGQLGRNFIPHITCGVEAFLEPQIGKPTVNDEGFLDHAYLPSFMHGRKRSYPRSFGAQFNYQNRRSVGWARSFPGMGQAYKDSIRAHYPAYVTLNGYTEMLPNERSFIDLDPALKDAYGIPLARRHWSLSESDWSRYEDMKKWNQEILRSAGGKIHSVNKHPETNHEIGGCRMGSDPQTSVLDASCRAHDVANLYVADASVFPNASEKNPTLTIMALALRTAETIADRLKKGEV
jgi:choline dehydrogenase-like flavoprotein